MIERWSSAVTSDGVLASVSLINPFSRSSVQNGFLGRADSNKFVSIHLPSNGFFSLLCDKETINDIEELDVPVPSLNFSAAKKEREKKEDPLTRFKKLMCFFFSVEFKASFVCFNES
jgi:hypothetical protein